MKKRAVIFFMAAVIVIAAASCKKIVDTFFSGEDFTLPTLRMTVPAILIADSTQEIQAGSFTTHINVDSTIKANTNGVFGINSISTVTVKQVTVNITNADGSNNLSAFKSFRLTIASNTKATVADMVNISFPANVTNTYTVTPGGPNIVDYLHGTTISNTAYGTVRKTTARALKLEVRITLFAK
jgi:hypothetical protein